MQYKCISCGRIWGDPEEGEQVIADFCPACIGQTIDDLIEEIEKKKLEDKDKRMREAWDKRRVKP
jgi:predicted  nucleic acid-binding Zn-ribbon protein